MSSSTSEGAPAPAPAAAAAAGPRTTPPPPLPSGLLPRLLASPVIHGFGRGSKQLGIPTANLDMQVVGQQVEALPTGIYYGWAYLPERKLLAKSCASIGYNPQFSNKQKTVGYNCYYYCYDYRRADFVCVARLNARACMVEPRGRSRQAD